MVVSVLDDATILRRGLGQDLMDYEVENCGRIGASSQDGLIDSLQERLALVAGLKLV